MNPLINNFITASNSLGSAFCDYAGSMFIQTGVLIVALLVVDLLIRKRVRATFRYWIWMLVFVKLVLPPTLSVPTGIGYWLGDYFVRDSVAARQPAAVAQLESEEKPAPPAIPEIHESVAPTVSDPPIMTATADSSVAPSLNVLTWQGILFGIWILGVLMIAALLVQRIFFVRGLIAQSESTKDQLSELLNQCRRRLGLRRKIELRLSHNVTSPAVCGLFHPAILIPKQILERLSQEKLRAVLIHELAHIKRGDLWINCAQTLLQIAYFYNPLVWLANTVVRRIREQAVDEMVLVALGAEARSYSNTLIDIAEMALSRPALSLRLVGVVESKKALSARIKHIITRPIPKTTKLGILSLITIILAATVLLPMAKGQSTGLGLFDRNKLIKFKSKDYREGKHESVGSTRFFTKTYSLRFRQGEKLLIVPELYKAGEPMQILGYKIFDPPVVSGELDCSFSYSVNRPKTVTTHHGSVKLGEQVFDIPEFKIENFPGIGKWSGTWRWFSGNALRQSTDRRGRDYGAMKVLYYYAGIYSKYNNNDNSTAKFWIPANNVTPREAPYALAVKVIPLSRLEHLYIEPVRGYQGLDGGLIEKSFTVKQTETIANEYKQRLMCLVNGASPLLTGSTGVIPEENDNEPNPFKTTLPNGATVELVGLKDARDKKNLWWSPDGKMLPEPVHQIGLGPYAPIDNSFDVNNTVEREFAFRLPKQLKAINIVFETKDRKYENIRDYRHTLVSGDDKSELRSENAILPAKLNSVNIRVGVAFGGGPTHTDKDYDWIEFKNVSLEPGVKTGVQIEIGGPNVLRVPSERYPMIPSAINTAKDGISTSYEKGEFVATLDDGETLELMGVCEHPNEGKQWWRPDGKLLDEAPDTRKARYDKSAYFDKTTERKIEIIYRCSWPESESRTVLFGKMSFRVLSHDYLGRLAEDKGYYSMVLAVPRKFREKTSDITFGIQKLGRTRRQWTTFKNVSLHPGQKTDVEVEVKAEPKVPEEMTGTWFFDNPGGDEEQMAVFSDSRVVVLYSNGHKDQTSYVNGFIELAEYGNARCRMAVQEDGTLVQRFGRSDSAGKRWKRIAVEPHINLLRSLTGASSEYGEKFSATLPNGLLVELVGLKDARAEGKNLWWLPDGKLLSEPVHQMNLGPYAPIDNSIDVNNTFEREFAFRFPKYTKAINIIFKTNDRKYDKNINYRHTLVISGDNESELRSQNVIFLKGLNSINVRVGVAFGVGSTHTDKDYDWIEFKNVSLQPGYKTDVQIEAEEATSPSGTTGFGPVDFEGYFEDSAAGGQQLERLWNDRSKDLRDADEILAIVRKGLRRYRGPGNILRWIGNSFIWGKNPQNPKAVELMYHASGSPERNLYGDAIYFGLSVTDDKTPEILQAMTAVAMKTDDYYNVTGRILWGSRNQKAELIACLEPYLNSDDISVRQKAQEVKDYFVDSQAFMDKRAKQHEEAVLQEYGDKLGQFRDALLTGSTQIRSDTLKQLNDEGIMSIVDESFLDAFEACTKDSDPHVRATSARMLGNKFVWSADPQSRQAIEILAGLLDDSDRSTRYAAVYYGLSTVRSPARELVGKMLTTILDDREINYYGRIIWGIRRNKQACIEILGEWMDQSEENSQRALKAYEIYEDVTAEPLPQEYAKRFAGQKSDAHEGVVAMCLPANPIGKEELQRQFLERLTSANQIRKVLDFYIFETREIATGMFVCANLADRNAIREALMKDNAFQVAGYMHGRIGPTGSGWIDSLKNFRERNKDNRVTLPTIDVQVEAEKPAVLRVPSMYPTIPSAIDAAKNDNTIVVDPRVKNEDVPVPNKPPVSSTKTSQYRATLPNGVTVELIGVCRHPSKGEQWWKPDGTLLEEAPYDKFVETPFQLENLFPGIYENFQRIELALRITPRTETPLRIGWRMESRGSMFLMKNISNKGHISPQLKALLVEVPPQDVTIEIKLVVNSSWIRIKNISLRPGIKTDVQIETERPEVQQVASERYPTIPSAIDEAKKGDTIVTDPRVKNENVPVPNKPPVSSTNSKQYKAILPNGVTVELLGVCESPSEGKQWWRPDGTILSQAPYHTTGNQSTDEKQGYVYHEFAIKLSDPDRMSYFWMIPGSGHGSDTGSPRDESGYPIPALKAYAANLPQEQETTTVRIGATAAEWQTVVAYKPDDREETYSEGEYAIAFGIPYMKGNRTLVPVVHNYNRKEKQYAIQVIATTESGQLRNSGYSGSGGNKLSSLTYIFNELPLETIKEFQFQVRPYTWVEFRNVSLRAGLKTGVQVISYGEDSRLPVSGRGEKKVFGIGPGWQELSRVVGDNYGGSIGGYNSDPNKCSEYFRKVLSWTQSGDTFVMLFAFDEEKRGHAQMVPEQYRDLLPIPWAQIKSRADQGELVEIKGKARGLDTIVLAAPELRRLTTLIRQTELLRAFKGINKRP